MKTAHLIGLDLMIVNCYMANASYGFYGLRMRDDLNLLEAHYKKIYHGELQDEIVCYYDRNRRVKYFED